MILLIIPQIAQARTQFTKSDFNPMVMRIKEDDYLGKIAPDIKMVDETGRTLSLSSFSKTPLILLLIYYDCPNICPLLGEGLADALNNIGDLRIGSDYNVLVLSFNKGDTPEKAVEFHRKLQRQVRLQDIDRWVFATAKEDDIKTITEAVGYRFFYSSEDNMFVHPSVYIFLSPGRKITRYIFGIKPDPFSIRLAVLESFKGVIGKVPISSLATLACYKYDAESRGYVLNLPFLFASVGVVMAVMTAVLTFVVYRKRKGLKTDRGR
ncbi:MAG: SCO family protein [Thermodesulfovibrionales bacterium]